MSIKQHGTFYEDFKPKTYTEMVDGEMVLHEQYDREGKVTTRQVFVDGKEVEYEELDTQGRSTYRQIFKRGLYRYYTLTWDLTDAPWDVWVGIEGIKPILYDPAIDGHN